MKAIEMFKSENSRLFALELYLTSKNYELPEIERLEKRLEYLIYTKTCLEYQLKAYKSYPLDTKIEDEDDLFEITVKDTIKGIALDIIDRARQIAETKAIISYLTMEHQIKQ